MEFASEGELFNYIVQKKRLDDIEASFFFVQIINGLEYIHFNNIVHRDFKPENLLLNEYKRIKIIDFGLSNLYKTGGHLQTACGSPCYAAPEMIMGKTYSGLAVDIWSVGIVLYAMVCGYLPFEDANNDKLYKKIINCRLEFPSYISLVSKNLIRKILNVNPKTRLKIEEIKSHPFYKLGEKQLAKEELIFDSNNNNYVLEKMEKLGFNKNEVIEQVEANKHNSTTTIYHLLSNKFKSTTYKKGNKLQIEDFEKIMRNGINIVENKNINIHIKGLPKKFDGNININITEPNTPHVIINSPPLNDIKRSLGINSELKEINLSKKLEKSKVKRNSKNKKSYNISKVPRLDIINFQNQKKRKVDSSLNYYNSLDCSIKSAKASFNAHNPIINLEIFPNFFNNSNWFDNLNEKKSEHSYDISKYKKNILKKTERLKFSKQKSREKITRIKTFKTRTIENPEIDLMNDEKFSIKSRSKTKSRAKTASLVSSNNLFFYNPKKDRVRNISLVEFNSDLGRNSSKSSTNQSNKQNNPSFMKIIEFSGNNSIDYKKNSNPKPLKNISINTNNINISTKTNNFIKKFVPNSTKNKNSINIQFKTTSFYSEPIKILGSKPISKLKVNKPTNNINISRSKSPPNKNSLIETSFKIQREKSTKDKSTVKRPSRLVIGDRNSKRKITNLVENGSKKDVKISAHRANYNSGVTYQEEFNTIVNANNQNILEKMQKFSITNNIMLREIAPNKFECKKHHNILIAEFINAELINKKLLKIKSRGNEAETKNFINLLINHLSTK